MVFTTLTLPSHRPATFDGSLQDGPLSKTSKATGTIHTTTPFGGKLLWVGNATCIIEFDDIRFMTDPNFLHAGE